MASQYEEFIIRLKDQFSGKLRDADDALDDARESADGLNDSLAGLKKVAGGLAVALGVGEIMDAAKEFAKLQGAVRAYTGQSGDAANDLITQAKTIADTYDEEASRVLQVANTLTKQMGGTMEENLALVQQGFAKGANVSGEFLDQLREYPAQFRAAGLSASESIALMAQASSAGVYSDKAADAIKETTLSLREMTQIQRDAINNIGVDADELLKEMDRGALSPFQAMQRILTAMDGFDIAAKQTVIADIFKGAGEDAGLDFIEGLKNIDLELNNIQDSQGGFTSAMFELNGLLNQFKTTLLAEVVPAMASFASFIANNVPLLKGLGVALGIVGAGLLLMKIQALAATFSWHALTAAMLANPIGAIIGLLAGLIGAVVWAYNEFEGFRNIVNKTWEAIKWLGAQLWDGLVKIITSVAKFIAKYHPVAILMRGVKTLFPKFFKSMMDRVKKFTSWLSDAWGAIKSFFGFGDDGEVVVKDGDTSGPSGNEESPSFTPKGSLTGGGLVSNATKASSNTSKSSGLSSLSNSAPKIFNVNINKLVETFTVETNTIEESRARIQQLVMEALLGGVNDVQSTIE